MQAPDKIYIQPNIEDDNDSIRTWLLSPFNDNSVPYIRKDVLLEWANNWEKIGVSDDFAYAIQTLIKHINSL